MTVDNGYLRGYDNLISLDFESQEITEGKTPMHIFLAVLIGTLLSVLVEMGIFYLFGFRQKRSWIIVVSMAVLIHGLTKLYVYIIFPEISSQVFFLVAADIFLLPLKVFFLFNLVKEHKISHRIIFLFTSFAACLLLVFLLLNILPN